MNRKLVITNYSIKHQVFDKRVPNDSDKYLKYLISAIKSSRCDEIIINKTPFLKFYLNGKKYQALVKEFIRENERIYLLILYRSKNNKTVTNIANTKEFFKILEPIFNQVTWDYKEGKFKTYEF